ncbi:MAG TPA: hypothetical protein VM452_17875 [Caulifigura sp.]|jgi:hypothetical protein|nr:hypothetical protein [Caulifigura sp.]
MSWTKASMRKDRQLAYFDAVLMAVSDAGGGLSRSKLIRQVAREVRGKGDTAWHVDRMVATMLRERDLVRTNGLLSLNTSPGAQQNR